VRPLAPQEERQPRRELEIVERKAFGALAAARRDRAIEEIRAREHGRDEQLDALVEAAGPSTPFLEERHQPIEIGLAHRTAKRAPREIDRDLLGARALPLRDLGLADEEFPAALGWRYPGRAERADQIHAAVDARHARRTGEAERLGRRERRDLLVVERA